MNRTQRMNNARIFRTRRTRARVKGLGESRPRLSVFRSNAHTYAQIIDDTAHKTIVSVSTKSLKTTGKKADQAKALGVALGKKAQEKGVQVIVFDRGRYKYHGRVRAVADGVREAGIQF